MCSGVSGRCAPADVEPAVLVGALYLDRTGSPPCALMAADGATMSIQTRRSGARFLLHNGLCRCVCDRARDIP